MNDIIIVRFSTICVTTIRRETKTPVRLPDRPSRHRRREPVREPRRHRRLREESRSPRDPKSPQRGSKPAVRPQSNSAGFRSGGVSLGPAIPEAPWYGQGRGGSIGGNGGLRDKWSKDGGTDVRIADKKKPAKIYQNRMLEN